VGRTAEVEPDGAAAKGIIDATRYLVLATADEAGRPWASPVYYANAGYSEFFWVSSPEATHSRNIAARPQVSIVIFDSTAAIGTGQGVYMEATAEAIEGDELERGMAVFSARSVATGGRPWTTADVDDAKIRMFKAVASGHSMLAKDGRPDHRVRVDLGA
jgi:nitroimidazol reductase NimA-like FMN-containing flavoprotein (pyridoxamine 5'-phosphate oxidase superfamily)